MTYADVQEALTVLGVGTRATLKEIRSRHRELVKRHHPDAGHGGETETIRKVNAAYKTLMEYVAAYTFSFDEDEFYEQNPEARIWMQFADDPLWGKR